MRTVRLPDGRVWLRVADPDWVDPLDPGWAAERGGRWNPPGSFPVLYLNGDVGTARLQIDRMMRGWPVVSDDLDSGAYVLVAATLPRSQTCAEAITPAGLDALGLPTSYPRSSSGEWIANSTCQPIGARVRDAGLRGVWCRTAASPDGAGRELAWFPASPRSQPHPVWTEALPYEAWRNAGNWAGIGLAAQPDPEVQHG